MYWQDLTRPALDALDRTLPVILPVAAIEQHGPHLPLSTDRIINEHFCDELDKAIRNRVLILPTQAVGCSRHHMDFVGTLTLTHETFITVAREMLECVADHGFTNLIVLNSHGGNLGAAQIVTESLGASRPNCRVVNVTWWRLAADRLLAISETGPGGVGHACEFETSLVLAAAPHLVDANAVRPGVKQPTFTWAEADLLRSPVAVLYRSFANMTVDGTLGDPTAATEQKGRMITEAVVAELRTIVQDLMLNACGSQ